MSFTLQGVGPFLHWLTLAILAIAPVLIAYVIYTLGNLPGSIARSRGHPQAEAINICGWMGIITLVLWPIALVWAYLVPNQPLAGGSPGADFTVERSELQRASQRLAALERKLSQTGTGG